MSDNANKIAIIGMSGRFPGAKNVDEFWANILAGREGIAHFTADELEIKDRSVAARPDYVKARAVLSDPDLFDPGFFGINPREAELMDPQHRIFLECCWEALEASGLDPMKVSSPVGIFAGTSAIPTYFLQTMCHEAGFIDEFTGAYQVGNYFHLVGNGLDFISTRVAYKLNLKGPAVTLQCACSTSLVAIVQACQALLGYQCDMALAGGVSITFPQKRGYVYQPDGMVSPDGHCRTFDANAQGTVFGSGAGVVLLKRLDDALADRDPILAVILGSAVNNDGAGKVGYAAPSVEGQAEVIALAQASAGVSPDTISYVEAHGTGTPLGDPIEIAALTKAFRLHSARNGFCAVGSAKPYVGHLDIAAGVTGLIKTVMSLKHGVIPPILHFNSPNPNIDFANSPFYVPQTATPWPRSSEPRRAGVSAFGVGGTNAHVVVEEAPSVAARPASTGPQLLVFSAKTEPALQGAVQTTTRYVAEHEEADLGDAAFTLATARHRFDLRHAVVAQRDNIASLTTKPVKAKPVHKDPKIVFMFPGQGAQYFDMTSGLYRSQPVFRKTFDTCAEILRPHLGLDLRDVVFAKGEKTEAAQARLQRTVLAQPAIFTVEYSLAQLWLHWGITPAAMIGHSVGEFVAACLAGVFSLEDALELIATRGRLMQDLPGGDMMAVRVSERELLPLVDGTVSVAAVNSPNLCVVSGPRDAVAALESKLAGRNIACRRLHTSHAFHSAMMDPILAPFTECVRRIRLHPPKRPYMSCVTGNWITEKETTSPEYWARHFRQPVLFSSGVMELAKSGEFVWLEVGPGNTLSTLVRQHPELKSIAVVSSLSDHNQDPPDEIAVLQALGELWCRGVEPRWDALFDGERRRVQLPTYCFDRKSYWYSPKGKETPPSVIQIPGVDFTAPPMAPLQPASPAAEQNRFEQMSRIEAIQDRLAELLEELSGIDASTVDRSATFIEAGLDSLLLTQFSQAIASDFEIKITFRQLMQDESSIAALAAFIDKSLAVGATPKGLKAMAAAAGAVPVAAAAPVMATAPAMPAAPAGSMQQLFAQQMAMMQQIFAQQMAMMQAGQAAAPASPTSPTAHIPAQTAAAPATEPPAADAKGEFKAFGPYKPMQKGVVGGLSAAQSKGLKTIIERYNQRTAKSKAYTQQYRDVLADPRVAAGFRAQWKDLVYPIVTVKSEGSRLWDVDGNEYIDILNGFGCVFFGHAPKFVCEAVAEQLTKGFEIGPQSPLVGEVASLISELTGQERVTFCNTGSEAVMAAMRLARTVTGRQKVVMFTGDYHGTFDEVLVKGITRKGEHASVPIAPGIPKEKAANVVVLDYATDATLEWIRQQQDEIAAVLIEPVQSRHPDLQPKEFLLAIREITEKCGAAMIMDEVVTGFRTHPGGVQALFGFTADLSTYGKVIGGGLPIGVLAGKKRFMDALDGGTWRYGDDSYPEVGVTFFAGTFVRHPLAMAAAKACLLHLKEQGPQLQKSVADKTQRLTKELNAFLKERGVAIHIQQFSSIFYFTFPPEFRFASFFYYLLRERGIHIQEGFPCFLTTAHTDADVDKVIDAFKQVIVEMQSYEFLPAPEESVPADPSIVQMTEPQLEVLLSAQLGTEASCAYNESVKVQFHGELDREAFRYALEQVVNRHEALRSTFDMSSRNVTFSPASRVELPFEDLSKDADPEERLKERIAEDAQTPFDLVNGPVFRTTLFKLREREHVVVFTSHHIVCDGWSINTILDELAKIYTAKVERREPKLDAIVPFHVYAHDQHQAAVLGKNSSVETYWLKQFEGSIPGLDLPLDRKRKASKSFAGTTYRYKISQDLYRNVKAAGAKEGCTLLATLMGGFYALLHRITRQDDIVIGLPSAGQSLVESGTLVGHCVNFLPVRAQICGETSFSQFLKGLKGNLLNAYDNQTYTYGTLVRKLNIPRDPSRLPLVEVQFNLERMGGNLKFSGLSCEIESNAKAAVNFDLFWNVRESDDGLTIELDYNTDLFDESTILRWLKGYELILDQVARNSKISIGDLSVLTNEDRETIARWNATAVRHEGVLAHKLIERQAATTPDALAVKDAQQQLTYCGLDERANRIANVLRQEFGAGPGKTVAIFLDRSADLVAALIAVLKTGAAYVPLDPLYPRERILSILDETASCAVVTEEAHASALADVKAPKVYMTASSFERASTAAPNVVVEPEQPAYVIFTSGTTGKPKGVVVPHRALANFLFSMTKAPGMRASDKLLAVTTVSFDIAALELFLPLTVGAALVVASREQTASGVELRKLLTDEKVSVMQATPVTWRMLLEAGWKPATEFKVLVGGEAVPQDVADALLASTPQVWNMYGPTETTIWSAAKQLRAGEMVTIGGPVANTTLNVVDAKLRPVPIGVPGELLIGGDGVALGYYKRPELTAERFVSDPSNAGKLAYRTGDLVRFLGNGDLEFLGRVDDQIKIRGFRIELGEVETALARVPGVKECAVALREDAPGDKRLVGYVVPQPGLSAPTSSQIRAFMQSLLPEYMVPHGVMTVDALPRTANGKVDRKRLPAPDWASAARERSAEIAKPSTPQEKTLAEIWSQVLKVSEVGVDQSIFDLGGDSLHIFQIVARANKEGITITPRHILEHRTIQDVLKALSAGSATAKSVSMHAVRRDQYRIVQTGN